MSFLHRARGGRKRGITSLPGLSTLLDSDLSLDLSEAPHGQAVARLRDLSGHGFDAVQTAGASQPKVDRNAAPGRAALSFTAGQHLKIPAAAGPVVTVYALVRVPAGVTASQVVLSQDTTAATTKPGWEVQIA